MDPSQPIDNEEFERLIELCKEKKSQYIDHHPKETKLKLYSAGRQGKFGNNTTDKPGILHPIERAKWSAWKDREGQDQEACKREFMALAYELLGDGAKK